MPQKRFIRQLLVGLSILPFLAAPAAPDVAIAPEPAQATGERALVEAKRHMIVTANPLASRVGLEILRQGGSAVDAAIAAQFMLNLVEPQSSGIGGGAFLVLWDAAKRELVTLDGREKAPEAAGPDLFMKPDGKPMAFWDAVVGGRSVGVPGTLALLEAMHRRWGKLAWPELVAPSIVMAEAGFAVSPRLAEAIADAKPRGLERFEPTRSYFLDSEGLPRAAGSILRNPDFAATLRQVAAGGSEPFYRGQIGRALVEAIAGAPVNPGQMTMSDLEAYQVVERPPICTNYRRNEICGMGPPSSGGISIAQIMELLEPSDLRAIGPTLQSVHLLLEASRLAFADRDQYVADADFVPVPSTGLLDQGYLTERARLIDPGASMGKAKPGVPAIRQGSRWTPDESRHEAGTSHLVVVDSAGNALSMTTTIETGMGSRLMTGGFLLNNELTDFAFTPAVAGNLVANRVEPRKRPRSSMAPTIVLDDKGEPRLLVGSPGGSRIIGYVAKTLVGVLDWQMDIQASIDLGHALNRNGATELEIGTSVAAFQPGLVALGHEVVLNEQASGLSGIQLVPGLLLGGADPRREGVALGD